MFDFSLTLALALALTIATAIGFDLDLKSHRQRFSRYDLPVAIGLEAHFP